MAGAEGGSPPPSPSSPPNAPPPTLPNDLHPKLHAGSPSFARLSALEHPFGRGFRMALPETLGSASSDSLSDGLSGGLGGGSSSLSGFDRLGGAANEAGRSRLTTMPSSAAAAGSRAEEPIAGGNPPPPPPPPSTATLAPPLAPPPPLPLVKLGQPPNPAQDVLNRLMRADARNELKQATQENAQEIVNRLLASSGSKSVLNSMAVNGVINGLRMEHRDLAPVGGGGGGETLDQRNARLANIIEAADRAAGGKLLNGHKARINTPADLANMNTDPKAVLAAIEAADKAAAQQGVPKVMQQVTVQPASGETAVASADASLPAASTTPQQPTQPPPPQPPQTQQTQQTPSPSVCRAWAALHECEVNAAFMKESCADACSSVVRLPTSLRRLQRQKPPSPPPTSPTESPPTARQQDRRAADEVVPLDDDEVRSLAVLLPTARKRILEAVARQPPPLWVFANASLVDLISGTKVRMSEHGDWGGGGSGSHGHDDVTVDVDEAVWTDTKRFDAEAFRRANALATELASLLEDLTVDGRFFVGRKAVQAIRRTLPVSERIRLDRLASEKLFE